MKATTPGAMSPRFVSDVTNAAAGHWPELLATSAAFLATLALILWGPLGL